MRVNLEKSRLEAAASLGAGGRRPFGGGVPPPPQESQTASLDRGVFSENPLEDMQCWKMQKMYSPIELL